MRFGWIDAARAVLFITCMGLMPIGCAGSTTRSTRLTDGDLNEVVQRMRTSLSRSDFFNQRHTQSPPAVIVITRAENLTSDVLSEGECWMLLARLVGAIPIQILAQQKNIAFQIAPERFELLRHHGLITDPDAVREPTHVMTARFRSTRRSGRQRNSTSTDLRAEYYYLEYQITHIHKRQIVWTDSFEFKREAVGLAID